MKIVAISGSYRKGNTIETLMEKALEGASAQSGSTESVMIRLVEKRLNTAGTARCRRTTSI